MGFQLVVKRGRSAVGAHRLGPGTTVAGRQAGCQLVIRSSQVSRRHCELFESDGQLIVKDLGTVNGTFVNGVRVEGQSGLKPGDMLTIGGVAFLVQNASPTAAAPAAVAVADAELDDEPAFEVEFAEDDEEPIAFEIEDEGETESKTPSPPAAAAPAAAAKPAVQPPAPAPAPPPVAVPETAEHAADLGEDAVADFLMNIQVDEDDKV